MNFFRIRAIGLRVSNEYGYLHVDRSVIFSSFQFSLQLRTDDLVHRGLPVIMVIIGPATSVVYNWVTRELSEEYELFVDIGS